MVRRKLFLTVLALFSLCADVTMAQERKPRDLARYAIGSHFELTWRSLDELERERQKARNYLWEQWRQKRLSFFVVADCLIYPEGCHDSVEYKIYVEPDEKGRWLIVMESEQVVSAWMSDKDKEQRSPRGRSVYSVVKKLAAGETTDCYPLFTERAEEPSKAARLRLTSGESGVDDRNKACVYF